MLKRIFDLTFATIGIVAISPVLLMIAAFIKFQSPGPVFYRGVRTGQFGIPFRMFKFRTMVVNAEQLGGPSTALNDPRVTKIGKFLRKYKLDELPQLFNVFLGDMSFVGPRPQVERYTKLYKDEELLILTVKPGITDYASLKFINMDHILGDENVDEKYLQEIEPEKNRLRVKYAKEQSILVDLKILIRTLLYLFNIDIS